MNAAQIARVLLVLAILFAVYKLVLCRRRRGRFAVQPFGGFERYDDEEDDYTGEEEDEDEEYDYTGEGDEDEEYCEEDEGEDEEDDEDEEYMVENYSNAMPSSGPMRGAPMMSVATDLLPKPSANVRSNFGEFAPKSLLGQNFLDAKKYVGVDTKGSSLRNANYDLRSSPAIPRKDVGPWSQSTIDSDLYRKPLE